MNIQPGMKRSARDPLGIELGSNLVRMLGPTIETFEAMGIVPERCKSCAFREGTLPNGYGETIMTALQCIAGDDIFVCHMDTERKCSGYQTARILGALAEESERIAEPVPENDLGGDRAP